MIHILLATRVLQGAGPVQALDPATHDEQALRRSESDDQQEQTGEQYQRVED